MTAAAAVGNRVLALRVIEQAIQDATAEPILAGRARSQCRPVEREQVEARRFLFAPAGEWAAARAYWCEAAGVSPEWLERQLVPVRGAVERAEHVDEWRRLTAEKGVASCDPLGGNQPHERGVEKAAEALGISKDAVTRASKIAALPQETRDQAREEGWSQDRLLNEVGL